MKKVLLLLLSLLSLNGYTKDGVKFTQLTTWQDVIAKAKMEQKYIFVDCYTTWCGPCRLMNRIVFVESEFGEVFNKEFISVKLQMDTTSRDNDFVKQWQKESHSFTQLYHINVYPTYLILTPEGKVVNKLVGSNIEYKDFLELAVNSKKTKNQYYTILEAFNSDTGNVQLARQLYSLSLTAYEIETMRRAVSVFIDKMPVDSLLTGLYVDMFRILCDDINGKVFEILLDNKDKYNLLDTMYSADELLAKAIIKNHQKSQSLNETETDIHISEEDYRSLFAGKYAFIDYQKTLDEVLLENWMKHKRFDLIVQKMDAITTAGYSLETDYLNSVSWYFFQHVDDKSFLERATYWSQRSLEKSPENYMYIDTYANLLYKTGRNKEAIRKMKEAISFINHKGEKERYTATMNKMKKGEPTW